LQVRCAIDQILRNSSNAAQLMNWSAAQRVWSNTQLTKCALQLQDEMTGTRDRSGILTERDIW